MAAFFPNSMIAMSDPFYGRTHDSTLMHECGWIRVLRDAAAHFGIPFTVFGDAAFGSSDVVQCMVKNVYHPDDSSFNATFYGNQLTHELNNEMRVSLKELWEVAK